MILSIKKSSRNEIFRINYSPTAEEAEQKEIESLNSKISQVKQKLGYWPPQEKVKEKKKRAKPTKEELTPKDTETLVINYIHHDITRMTFTPPKPLFDEHGVPLR